MFSVSNYKWLLHLWSFKWNLYCVGFVKDLVNEGASHQPAQLQGRKRNLNVLHAAASIQSTTELLKWVCTKSWFSSKTSEEILEEVGSERDEAYLSKSGLCWRSLSVCRVVLAQCVCRVVF